MQARFVPIAPWVELETAVDDFLKWLKFAQESKFEPVVVAAMAHYQTASNNLLRLEEIGLIKKYPKSRPTAYVFPRAMELFTGMGGV